jgi:hypothetical protein
VCLKPFFSFKAQVRRGMPSGSMEFNRHKEKRKKRPMRERMSFLLTFGPHDTRRVLKEKKGEFLKIIWAIQMI